MNGNPKQPAYPRRQPYMNFLKNFVIDSQARQYAWYMHRFRRGDKARDNVELANGLMAALPFMLAIIAVLVPLVVALNLDRAFVMTPVVIVVVAVLVQRYADRVFLSNHDAISAAATEILEDPLKGPHWALRRQLLLILMSLVLFILAAFATRESFMQHDLVANPERFPRLATISQYYHNNERELNAFSDQLERDENFAEVFCDANRMQARKVGERDPDPMNEEYRAIYAPLCEFAPKVSAHRTARGIRFPRSFFEEGDLFVLSFLERRRDPQDLYEKCDSRAYSEPSGECDVSLNSRWSITYSWEPYCRQGMEDVPGCE